MSMDNSNDNKENQTTGNGQEDSPVSDTTAEAEQTVENASADAAQEQSAETAEPAPEASESQPDELEQVRQEMKQTFDKYLRLQAEFENYKKRIQKEHSDSLKFALSPLLKDLIGIMDNLERAVDHAKKNPGDDHESLLSGIEMVMKQMQDTFEKFGMVRIEAVGKAFDPTLHEAMSVVETNDVTENHVLEEFQAGYTLNERVVRPAMVSVAKAAESGD